MFIPRKETPILNTSSVLVLSDNEVLSKVVELVLVPYSGVQIRRLGFDQTLDVLQRNMFDDFDLIVLLISSTGRDPLACLARVGLDALREKTPLIVSSICHVPENLAGNMIQIGFPFEIDSLQAAIQGVLGRPNGSKNQPLREYLRN